MWRSRSKISTTTIINPNRSPELRHSGEWQVRSTTRLRRLGPQPTKAAEVRQTFPMRAPPWLRPVWQPCSKRGFHPSPRNPRQHWLQTLDRITAASGDSHPTCRLRLGADGMHLFPPEVRGGQPGAGHICALCPRRLRHLYRPDGIVCDHWNAIPAAQVAQLRPANRNGVGVTRRSRQSRNHNSF